MRTENFQVYKLDLEKAEKSDMKFPTFVGSMRKQENSRKTSASLTMVNSLTVCITINCGKFSEMGKPDHLTYLLRNLYASQEATVRTLHGTTDWFKIWKRVYQGQSISCEMPGWMSHRLESRLPRELSTTSDVQMIRL